MNCPKNASTSRRQVRNCAYVDKLQITWFILLLTATAMSAQATYVYEGKIDYKVQDNSMKLAFIEMPHFDCSDAKTGDNGGMKLYPQCILFSEKQYEAGQNDTLIVSNKVYRAVWTESKWSDEDIAKIGDISEISVDVFFTAPNAPYLMEAIVPNPNDGNFEIEYNTNATRQYTMIIDPDGQVYSNWGKGTQTVSIHLNSQSPSGIYQVITRWYFEEECKGMAVTRQGFTIER